MCASNAHRSGCVEPPVGLSGDGGPHSGRVALRRDHQPFVLGDLPPRARRCAVHRRRAGHTEAGDAGEAPRDGSGRTVKPLCPVWWDGDRLRPRALWHRFFCGKCRATNKLIHDDALRLRGEAIREAGEWTPTERADYAFRGTATADEATENLAAVMAVFREANAASAPSPGPPPRPYRPLDSRCDYCLAHPTMRFWQRWLHRFYTGKDCC